MRVLLVLSIFIAAGTSVLWARECENSCTYEESCIEPIDGPIHCRADSQDGEPCEPPGRERRFKYAKCTRGYWCTVKDPKNTKFGVCEAFDQNPPSCAAQLVCPKNTCCVYSKGEFVQCSYGKAGDSCSNRCSCNEGLTCVQRNETQQVCLPPDQLSQQKCGDYSCLKSECCVDPPDGGSPSCQPFAQEGDSCGNGCSCNEGLTCVQRSNTARGVCRKPKPKGLKCGCSDCSKSECCVYKSNRPDHCAPIAKEGNVCSQEKGNKTFICGCEKGLRCMSSPLVQISKVGVCRRMNRQRSIDLRLKG